MKPLPYSSSYGHQVYPVNARTGGLPAGESRGNIICSSKMQSQREGGHAFLPLGESRGMALPS